MWYEGKNICVRPLSLNLSRPVLRVFKEVLRRSFLVLLWCILFVIWPPLGNSQAAHTFGHCRLELAWFKETDADLQKKIDEVQSSIEMARLEKERVHGEFTSAKRVYDDYHRRMNELIPVVKSCLKVCLDFKHSSLFVLFI